jgi:hypothetical protein
METYRSNTQGSNNCRRRRVLGTIAGAALLAFAGLASANVILYGQPDMRGRSFVIDHEVANLDHTRWNDRASSLVIDRGMWEVCTDAYFRGNCRVLGPGSYASLGSFGDRISSLRPVHRGAWRDRDWNDRDRRWWDDRAEWREDWRR